jgi:ATP-dependent RNA helicase DeaD
MGGTSLGLERRELTRNPRIIVGTPGRTLDHLKAGALDCSGVTHIVLDEADRMLDMGFREELEAILGCVPDKRRTHLVSATFDPAVRRLADRVQDRPLHVQGTKLGAANQDIEHVAHLVDACGVYAAIVNHLLLNEGQRCLIFVERRVDVTSLTEKLSADGFPVQAFSGELPQAQRTRTLGAFRDGTIKTLVSTDVAARGIDVPNIELVIHADPPESAYAYVHRSGRTGRAGSTGCSVLLVQPKARRYVTRVLETNRIVADWQPAPAPSRVRKSLRRRFRQTLHERLAVEGGADQKQVDYAKLLLEGRDPAEVVAHLLELAQPAPARAPMDVPEPSQSAATRADHGDRGARGRRAPANRASSYVTFSINWGKQSGAAPNRVLSHVCRRGDVRGRAIGTIKVGPSSSTFDVDAKIADRFETRAQRRDPREPKLRIVRARGGAGPVNTVEAARRAKPGAPFKSKPRTKRKPKRPGARAKQR